MFKAIRFTLLACVFLGLGCRFYGLNWDEGAQLHPDERFCVSVVEKLRFPATAAQFFDSRVAPLNPANSPGVQYVYGQLPLFLLKIAAQGVAKPAAPDLMLVGRFLSALVDCGTVWLSFLIARRLLDAEKALLCAALVSCAALHIQQSHFFVVDPFAAFFTTASFWAGTRLVQTGRRRDALSCGALFGLALACKISAALFAVALLGFLVVFARRNGLKRALSGAVLVIFAALVAFRVGHPMAFRGEFGWLFGFFDLRLEPRFWAGLLGQSGITRGQVDVPFNVQWIGRAPLVYSLRQLGFWGYGWPFLLSAGLGIALLPKKPRGNALFLVAALLSLTLLGVQGAAFSKFTRYFLPLTPFCALLAGYGWREIEKKRAFLRFGGPFVALCAAAWALCVASIYGRTNTRVAASRWINQNVSPRAVVASESAWDDALPLWNLRPTGLNLLDLDLHAPDSDFKTATLAAKLDRSEWIFISSGRGWQNIPRWSEKWPVTTEYYRALFDGRLGFRLEKRFDSFPTLFGWQFPDANAEEALTVYDHPLVLLFRKTKGYDSAQMRGILEAIPPPDSQGWQPNLAPPVDERALPVPPGF